MQEKIKQHLEERCKVDPCMAEKFNPEQLDDCWEFIVSMARDMAKDESAIAIEDDIVYKWARDYFIEGKAEMEAKRKAEEEARKEEARKKAEEERKARELAKIKEEQEKREKAHYEMEHKNGQTTIFDILGG